MALTEAQHLIGTPARDRAGGWHAWLAVGGVCVSIGAAVLASRGVPSDAAFGRGLLELLVVGTPIVAGLYALRAPANRSFGIVLLLVGFLWSLTALAESASDVPHTIGRLATWLPLPCVIYLLLAFPNGRIEPGLDRALFGGVVGVMVLLFFGTVPFVAAFPTKTLWSTCTAECPANALFLLDAQPAFLTKVSLVREWLVELLWLGIFFSMFRRWKRASRLQQRTMGPVLVAGTMLGLFHIAHITTRQLGAPTDTVVGISSAWTFCIVAVCAAFVLGLFRRRVLLAGALSRLSMALRGDTDRRAAHAAMADALGDPTLELLFRAPGAPEWVDQAGRPAEWPQPLGAGRAATALPRRVERGREELVLLHEAALRDDEDLLEGAGTMVLAASRHQALESDLASALTDLEESRRRIAEAADLERARIERDLHDGAQQRLVALRIRLSLAEDGIERDPASAVVEIRALGVEAEDALEELRALAHGVYPPVLADRGLEDGLKSMAAKSGLPVHVVATNLTRQPTEIESAVYFTCVEALQNATKHAGADAIWIKLTESRGRLRFEIRDDGAGFAPGRNGGRGVQNMHDRMEAIGGRLEIDTAPGRGTRVSASVDLRPA